MSYHILHDNLNEYTIVDQNQTLIIGELPNKITAQTIITLLEEKDETITTTKKQWVQQITETRTMLQKYYDAAIENGEGHDEIINDIMNEFEGIDDQYIWDR